MVRPAQAGSGSRIKGRYGASDRHQCHRYPAPGPRGAGHPLSLAGAGSRLHPDAGPLPNLGGGQGFRQTVLWIAVATESVETRMIAGMGEVVAVEDPPRRGDDQD